jgi:WXG100 family type VII secretion target
MSVFNVDSEQVSSAALTADQSAMTIRTEVSQMMAFLQGLNESWGGTAASGFQSVIEQWRTTQVQVDESLVAISTHLQLAATTYSDAETSAASLFAQ